MKQFLKCLIVATLVAMAVTAPQKVVTPAIKDVQKKGEISAASTVVPDPPKPVLVAPVISTPSPVAEPAGDCNKWRHLIAQYDWNVEVAINVCNAESGGRGSNDNPNDRHPSAGPLVCWGSRGLFQIGCDSVGNYAAMFDPAANIAQAYSMYARRGWQPWGYTTCKYKVACY